MSTDKLDSPRGGDGPHASGSPIASSAAAVYNSGDHVIDVRDLIGACWRGKWFILLFVCFGAVYGGWKLHRHQPVYQAYLIAAPTEQIDAQSSGGAADRIAQALGATRGNHTNSMDKMEVMIGSRQLAEKLQLDHGLLQTLFSGAWNEETGGWNRPPQDGNNLRSRIRAFFNLPNWSPPSIERLAVHLRNGIGVQPVKLTAMRRISYAHSDPEMAMRVLQLVYTAADDLMREQDRQRLEQQKRYLLQKIRQVELNENRQILLSLLSRAEQGLMLLDNDFPYVAAVVDPPRLPKQPVPPRVIEIVGLPTVAAFVISLAIVLGFALYRMESAGAPDHLQTA